MLFIYWPLEITSQYSSFVHFRKGSVGLGNTQTYKRVCFDKKIMATNTSGEAIPAFGYFEVPANPGIPEWFTIAFASINGGGFCLNTLSLWLLATRKFVYRYKINAFIVSLCFADFLVSLASFYFLGTITSHNMANFSKRVATIIYSFALETSLMSLCFLSFERLVAVRKPFRYNEILSKSHITAIMIFGWTFCLSLLGLQFLFGFVYKNDRYVYVNWVVFVSLSILAIVVLAVVYVYLIYEIHRHSVHIKSCSISSRPGDVADVQSEFSDHKTEVTYTSGSSGQSSSQMSRHSIDIYVQNTNKGVVVTKPRAEQQRLLRAAIENTKHCRKKQVSARKQLAKKERRSVLLCFSIVLVFAASWLPVIVFFTRCIVSNTCETDDRLLYICSCMVSINSLLDPVLYFILKREFKDFLFGKICGLSRQRRCSSSYASRRGSSGDLI